MADFERREYKYFVPASCIDSLRERFLQYMEHDPFCRFLENNKYHVRSIYYDTPKFNFYFEKKAGLKIRKKVRIRSYNFMDDKSYAFFEIKRKYNNIIFKNRAKIDFSTVPILLNGADYRNYCKNLTFIEKASLERFIYLMKRLNLESKVLVTYEREAFFGKEESDLRVTFDTSVRSYPHPVLEDIFRDEDMNMYIDNFFVLEVKFWGRMPVWVRNVLRDFSLRQESISKYCLGIDALPQFTFLNPD